MRDLTSAELEFVSGGYTIVGTPGADTGGYVYINGTRGGEGSDGGNSGPGGVGGTGSGGNILINVRI